MITDYRTVKITNEDASERLPVIFLNTDDVRGRIVQFELWNDGNSVSGSGMSARFYILSQGTSYHQDMVPLSGTETATWQAALYMDDIAPGEHTAEIRVTDTDGTIVATRPFTAIVERGVIGSSSGGGSMDTDDPIDIVHGGTGMTTSPVIIVDLASSSSTNVLQSNPTPGVTGTLTIAHGGTGATTAANAPWLQKSGGTMTGQIVGLTGTSGYINRSGTVQDATAAVTSNQGISYYHDYDGSNHRVGYTEITREPNGVYRSFVVTNPSAAKNFGIYFHVTDAGALSFDTSEAAASKAIAQGLGLDAPTVQTFYWSGGAYITNGQKQIVFSVPFRKPVNATGCTLTSVECIVRQNNNYRFGSSASVWVTPTTKQISNLYLDYGQVELMLDYPADSTTTNNDACGVRAKVTLTFTY